VRLEVIQQDIEDSTFTVAAFNVIIVSRKLILVISIYFTWVLITLHTGVEHSVTVHPWAVLCRAIYSRVFALFFTFFTSTITTVSRIFRSSKSETNSAMKQSRISLLLVALSITHYVAASKLQDRSVDLPVAKHSLPLHRLHSSQLSGRNEFLSSRDIAVSGHTESLRNVRDIFGVDVQVGDTTSTLIFDTGSPFTWVPGPGFLCVDSDGNQLSVPFCALRLTNHC
jgi:hypothetical protein